MITISIIIPTFNEAENIEKLIQYIIANSNDAVVEILITDGGSTDKTVSIAKSLGVHTFESPQCGRAAQMNYGAALAKGDVLYFIHADCYPPKNFIKDIQQAIEKDYELGRFRSKFNTHKLILKINAWFTRFDLFICMGGDQTLFIKRSLFSKCKGFDQDMKIMEEYEFCKRARRLGKYKILNDVVLISARKYDNNSWLKVQLANYKIVRMYKRGESQQKLLDTYKQMLRYRKSTF